MKFKYSYLAIFLMSFFLWGCFTQLDLVDRSGNSDYYYTESGDEDSVIVENQYDTVPYFYDPYYDFSFYWDSWWWYPRWGLFIGYYPWCSWGYYYRPYGWWYYGNYYYPYWYGNGYVYRNNNGFQRRPFNRRGIRREGDDFNRIVTRSSNERLLSKNSGTIRKENRAQIRTGPSIRRERPHRGHSVIRQPSSRRYGRNSSARRPSFSGRSFIGSRSSNRSTGFRGSSGSSRSTRSSHSSSHRSSRR